MAGFQFVSPDIAVDIGTDNTRVYVKDKGIVVNNRDLVVQYCNGAAMRIFGIREDQRVGQELSLDRWHVVDEHGREMQRHELPAQRALDSAS